MSAFQLLCLKNFCSFDGAEMMMIMSIKLKQWDSDVQAIAIILIQMIYEKRDGQWQIPILSPVNLSRKVRQQTWSVYFCLLKPVPVSQWKLGALQLPIEK